MTKPARQTKTAPAPSLAQTAASAMAHPLFPLITGLWFAALFGLGAVVAGGEALAALAGHLHLTAIVPSAAPPLGRTAHILIAIGLTGLGAAFGLALGLVLRARATGSTLFNGSLIKAGLARARAAKPEPLETAKAVPVERSPTPTPRVRNRDAHPDAPPRRPLVVTEDVLPYHAPAAPTDAREPAAPVTIPPAWTAQVIDPEVGTDFIAAPLGAFMTGHPAAEETAHAAEVPPFLAGNFGDAPPLALSGIYGSGDPIVLPPETGEHVELAHAQPAPAHDSAPAFHTGPMPLASQAAVAPREPIMESPVDSLGLVQLIERLALAITVRQAKRAALGYRTVPAPVAADESDEPLLRVKPSRLGRVNDTMAAPGNPVVSDQAPVGDGVLPASLHDPLAHIDMAHHDWTDAADHALPARFLRNPVEPSVLDAADMTDLETPEDTFVAPHSIFGAVKADAAEPQYSSLVNMTMARARLSDSPDSDAAYPNDPVVPFLVQSGDHTVAAPMRGPTDQADRALRDALATLRRMSAQR